MRTNSRKGFTLIELMIVVAILGTLASVAIPKFADMIRKAKEGATKGNLGAMRSACSLYYANNEGLWPSAWMNISDYLKQAGSGGGNIPEESVSVVGTGDGYEENKRSWVWVEYQENGTDYRFPAWEGGSDPGGTICKRGWYLYNVSRQALVLNVEGTDTKGTVFSSW